MLKNEISDDRVLPWLYTQDSTNEIYENPETWKKSNPSLGVVKTMAYLDDVMNKSKNDHSTRVTMLCKDFNIKQVDQGAWLTFADLNNESSYSIDSLRGSYAIGGVDLSSTTDLTSSIPAYSKEGWKEIYHSTFLYAIRGSKETNGRRQCSL
jgi:phage terminase large subunit-like protein